MAALKIGKIVFVCEKFFTDTINVYIKQEWHEPA
jgi:hypothetical protein